MLAKANIVSQLIEQLKKQRIDQGLTIEDLADKAGIHRTTLGLIERGERSPSLLISYQIAKALGFNLGELISLIESSQGASIQVAKKRTVKIAHFHNEEFLVENSGLTLSQLKNAIESTYNTFDLIDTELISKGITPISSLVELANLSSMLGNVIGAEIAVSSNGLYIRNRPHSYPDLVPLKEPARDIEIKVALETNKPKGHLPKAGLYLTFRYILASKAGVYLRGKSTRGDTIWLWEVRFGAVSTNDFSISNTPGDSGKTAVIRTDIFNSMKVLYLNPDLNPHMRETIIN